MADGEVVIDDGGSTRIKQLAAGATRPGANGNLDTLLDVTNASPQGTAIAIGPFSQLTLVSLNTAGSSTTPPSFSVPVVVGDSFEITSDNNQKLEGRIVNRTAAGGSTADCELTVRGGGACRPLPEAKRNGTQRRYIVSNSGGITDVRVTLPGPRPNINVNVDGALYNVVIVS